MFYGEDTIDLLVTCVVYVCVSRFRIFVRAFGLIWKLVLHKARVGGKAFLNFSGGVFFLFVCLIVAKCGAISLHLYEFK